MSELIAKKAESGLKSWLIGGSILLAACASALIIKNKKSKKSTGKLNMSEEEVFKVLRDFRKEFYPVLKTFATASKTIQTEYMGRFGYQPENIKDILFTHIVDENPNFEKNIEAVELKVLARNNIGDPDAFRDLCRDLSKKSPRIENIMREIKMNFEKSVLGLVLPVPIDVPKFITPETTLYHFKDMTQSMAFKLAKLTQEFRKVHGDTEFGSVAYQEAVHGVTSDSNIDKYVSLYPEQLCADFHIQQIFIAGLTHYTKADPNFTKIIQVVEKRNQEIIKKIHQPNCDYDAVYIDIEEISHPKFGTEEEKKEGFFIDLVPSNDQVKETILDKMEEVVENNEKVDVSPEQEFKHEAEENKIETQQAKLLDTFFKVEPEVKEQSEVEETKDLYAEALGDILGEALRGDKDIIGSHIATPIEVEFKDHTVVNEKTGVEKVQETKEVEEIKKVEEVHHEVDNVENQEAEEKANDNN